MAENKKSFILYADLIDNIDHLTNEEKGMLFTHLLEYVNDMKPILEDRLILTAWKPIERQLKRDLKKFEEIKSKRSDAGKRSAELRALNKEKEDATNPTSVESVQRCSTNPTVNDNVNDNVNVIYNKQNFLDNFNQARTHFTGEQSFINRLYAEDEGNLNEALEHFTDLDIQDAIKGLFQQEYFPQEVMRSKPTHLLKNIDMYVDAFRNKKKNLYKE